MSNWASRRPDDRETISTQGDDEREHGCEPYVDYACGVTHALFQKPTALVLHAGLQTSRYSSTRGYTSRGVLVPSMPRMCMRDRHGNHDCAFSGSNNVHHPPSSPSLGRLPWLYLASSWRHVKTPRERVRRSVVGGRGGCQPPRRGESSPLSRA